MDPYPEFSMSLEAIIRAREMVKGKFSIDTEGGGEVTQVERACIQAFNTHWAIKANPLGTQIWYLLTRYSPEELSVEPGLSIYGKIMDTKSKIDFTEHSSFWKGLPI